MALSTIIGIAILSILLVVVLTFIFFPGAILPKAADAGESIADNVIINIKKNEPEKSSLEIDKGVEESYENILTALRTEGEGPCIVKYKPLASDFNGFKITLSEVDEGIFVQLENKKGQFVKSNTIGGKIPCIINPINFYNNHLAPSSCKQGCLEDYNDASITFINNKNILANNYKMSIPDSNILYKPDKDRVCFIPIKKWAGSGPFSCGANEESLDNHCMDLIKKIKTC